MLDMQISKNLLVRVIIVESIGHFPSVATKVSFIFNLTFPIRQSGSDAFRVSSKKMKRAIAERIMRFLLFEINRPIAKITVEVRRS